ncbi:hypothetical protein BZA70DRAFT_136914 [Myxozyma melibiosi]|uniref:Uncharacterized protein n=1 Tax=Myxozyma melibiosi TaxID=54550 RepID=A0ABR1F766_9ASCO
MYDFYNKERVEPIESLDKTFFFRDLPVDFSTIPGPDSDSEEEWGSEMEWESEMEEEEEEEEEEELIDRLNLMLVEQCLIPFGYRTRYDPTAKSRKNPVHAAVDLLMKYLLHISHYRFVYDRTDEDCCTTTVYYHCWQDESKVRHTHVPIIRDEQWDEEKLPLHQCESILAFQVDLQRRTARLTLRHRSHEAYVRQNRGDEGEERDGLVLAEIFLKVAVILLEQEDKGNINFLRAAERPIKRLHRHLFGLAKATSGLDAQTHNDDGTEDSDDGANRGVAWADL